MYDLLNAIELELRYQRWLAGVPKYAGHAYGRTSFVMYLARVGLSQVREIHPIWR